MRALSAPLLATLLASAIPATATAQRHHASSASHTAHAPRAQHAATDDGATTLHAHARIVHVTSNPSAIGEDLRDLQFEGNGGGIHLTGNTSGDAALRGGHIHVFVPDNAVGRHAEWRVAGGLVTLASGHTIAVGAGTLHVLRRGAGSWLLSGGEISIADAPAPGAIVPVNTATGEDRDPIVPPDPAPLAPSGPVIDGNAHTPGPTMLPASELAALDELASLAPRGSRDAIRQASANEVTIHNAENPAPSIYSVPITGRSVVLVVDTSYSMRDRDPDAQDATIDPTLPPSKLDVARAELVRTLAALPAGTAVDIVAFSSDVQTLWPEPRALDESTLHEAIRWVAALRPGDETDPLPAVERANAMHPEQIVFVSDGRPTDHDAADQALAHLATEVSSRGARLDIVGIGPDQDASFLDRIAQAGGGIARHR